MVLLHRVTNVLLLYRVTNVLLHQVTNRVLYHQVTNGVLLHQVTNQDLLHPFLSGAHRLHLEYCVVPTGVRGCRPCHVTHTLRVQISLHVMPFCTELMGWEINCRLCNNAVSSAVAVYCRMIRNDTLFLTSIKTIKLLVSTYAGRPAGRPAVRYTHSVSEDSCRTHRMPVCFCTSAGGRCRYATLLG